jgi:hypothetical protein
MAHGHANNKIFDEHMRVIKKISILNFFLPLAARAQDLGGGMLKNTASNGGYKGAAGQEGLTAFIGTIISLFLNILGILFLLYTLYGGYMWLIARGNEEKVNTAKDTLKNGIIGLIICLGAYAISAFVLGALSKSTLTQTK